MPSVGPLASGFSQCPSAYLAIVSTLNVANFLTYTAGTGSGGAALPGSFAAYNNDGNVLNGQLNAGGMLKDMGKTVISSGRVFRKVQVMATAAATGLPGGSVPAGTGLNFVSGYLEVASDAGDTPNALARF